MMRTKRIITAGTVAVFALSAGLSAQQERSPQPGQQQQQQERPEEVGAMGQEQQDQQAHRLSALQEATVQSQDGEELGQVEDLAIDLENGQLGFLMVSNGDDALHPVPPEALQISGGQQDLQIELNIDQENWEDAPTVERQEVAELDQQSDEIYEFFGEERQDQEQEERTLHLAGDLTEITLRDENDEEIGNISDLLVNIEEGEVPFALLQPRRAEEEFAVATRALQMESEDEISLHVTREDFEQVETLTLQEMHQKAEEQQEMEVAQVRESPELYRFQEDEQVFGERPRREQEEEGEADIRVQQPAPDVQVQQPAPDVRVQQPETEVQVEQAEPQVEVQQPDPEVEVDQQEPEVRVEQQEPEVHIEQDEPEVEVERQERQRQEDRDRDDEDDEEEERGNRG